MLLLAGRHRLLQVGLEAVLFLVTGVVFQSGRGGVVVIATFLLFAVSNDVEFLLTVTVIVAFFTIGSCLHGVDQAVIAFCHRCSGSLR